VGALLQFQTPKKVSATLAYRVRFTQWLAPTGDALATATVTYTPNDLTLSPTVVVTGDSVIFTVEPGGTAGELYRFDVAFTTVQGQSDTKSVYLRLVS
jgi:hypothetical protein